WRFRPSLGRGYGPATCHCRSGHRPRHFFADLACCYRLAITPRRPASAGITPLAHVRGVGRGLPRGDTADRDHATRSRRNGPDWSNARHAVLDVAARVVTAFAFATVPPTSTGMTTMKSLLPPLLL